jgi:hypothetical protein
VNSLLKAYGQCRPSLFWGLCFILVIATGQAASAQSNTATRAAKLADKVISDEEEVSAYRTEWRYGVQFNTVGGLIGGFGVNHSILADAHRYHSFGLDLVHIKNPKEFRVSDLSNNSSNSFIAYKTQYLFTFRPHYGQELVLFGKAPEEGVHINALLQAGPSLGLLKPYYVLYENGADAVATSVPYTSDIPLNQIRGPGGPLDGLNQLKTLWGVHAKASLTFEFGPTKGSTVGIELGVLAEAYRQKYVLLPVAPSRSSFTSLFLSVYFGSKN